MATLYLVSTPIGNLGDLTERAREVLEGVDRILAEDTRRTRTLLAHLGLHTPLVSLHAHNERAREERVLRWLGAGEELALVADAGTPLVSDPGARLVEAVVRAGYRVVPVPGPSAVLAGLVASGLPADRFAFLGFPPRKGRERKRLLERVARSEETVVLFEAPGRLRALLRDLEASCGGDRRAAVAREVTKLHEEFVRGTLAELREAFREREPRGEVTVVVEAAATASPGDSLDLEEVRALSRALLAEGRTPRDVVREVVQRTGLSRNTAYRLVQEAHGHADA